MYEDFEYGPVNAYELGELEDWQEQVETAHAQVHATGQLPPARDLELVLSEIEIAGQLFLNPAQFGFTETQAFAMVASRLPLWSADAIHAQSLIDSLMFGSEF